MVLSIFKRRRNFIKMIKLYTANSTEDYKANAIPVKILLTSKFATKINRTKMWQQGQSESTELRMFEKLSRFRLSLIKLSKLLKPIYQKDFIKAYLLLLNHDLMKCQLHLIEIWKLRKFWTVFDRFGRAHFNQKIRFLWNYLKTELNSFSLWH